MKKVILFLCTALMFSCTQWLAFNSVQRYEYSKDGKIYYIGYATNGKQVLLDSTLQKIIPPYNSIGSIYEDYIWVILNKKVGYIDRKFTVVIPIEYDDGRVFANGMVRVFKNQETIYLNRNGEIIHPSEQEIKAYDETLARMQAGYDAIQFSS